MRTSTKIGIAGLVSAIVIQVAFGIIEIVEYRKGKRKLHPVDIELLAKELKKIDKEVKTKAKTVKTEDQKG